jgi:hypothetical protein
VMCKTTTDIETEEEVSYVQTVFSPRAKRMQSLRRLVQRAEAVLQSADPARRTPGHRELAGLTTELERELSRLEQMPWPSERALRVQGVALPADRRAIALVRELRGGMHYAA